MISAIKGYPLNYLWARINEMPDRPVEWWQIYRLNKILKVSAGLVGMYKDIFGKAGVKDIQVKALFDLEKLPVITKALMGEYPPHSVVNVKVDGRYGFSNRALTNYICRGDGELFRYVVDKKFCVMRGKLVKAAFRNINLGKDRFVLIGKFLYPYSFGPNCLMVPYSMLKGRKEDFLKVFSEARPEYIFFDNINIMNSFRTLCLDCQFRPSPNLKSIILFSVDISDKERSEGETFFGAPIFLAKYSLFEEAPFLGWECGERNGLHLNRQSYILEIVDENGRQVQPGQAGRVVITNFENELMPLIRYDTGERGRFLGKPCGCGRMSPLFMIDPFQVKDMIMTDRVIRYTDLQDVFSYYWGAIKSFEAVAETNRGIRIQISPGKIWDDNILDHLENSLRTVTGPDTRIDFNIINVE